MKIHVVRYVHDSVHAGRMSFVNTDGCTTVVFGQVCPRADALGPWWVVHRSKRGQTAQSMPNKHTLSDYRHL